MSDNEESQPTPAPEEPTTQPSEAEAEATPSDGGAGRQHNSDSWVIVDDPDNKPAADT